MDKQEHRHRLPVTEGDVVVTVFDGHSLSVRLEGTEKAWGELYKVVRDTMEAKQAREEGRAELGVHMGTGFAKLGDEVEVVDIVDTGNETKDGSLAASRALQKLENRLGRTLTYWIGPKHPKHC